MSGFFEVDKEGLAKIAERRGKVFVLHELLQNAWDTDAGEVKVTLEPVPGKRLYRLVVEDDDPSGFSNLSHAWTLFAESEKKGRTDKRGRFNLGEKLVLALCQEASIVTTTGGVRFEGTERHVLRQRRDKGSLFEGLLRMTKSEYEEIEASVPKLLVPHSARTWFNGVEVPTRQSCGMESAVLITEVADEEGFLRRRPKRTKILFHEVRADEVGTLYEMGIPVCETGDKYHADVAQKVPLNLERDGVSPSYLRIVRTAMLNTLAQELKPEDATSAWVRDAMGSEDLDAQAGRKVMELRFGAERVSYDPSDKEANDIATSRGMTVVSGGSLSADEWANVKRFDLLKPAGQVTPSPKPFSPDGRPLRLLAREDATEAVLAFERFAKELFSVLDLGRLTVMFADDRGWGFAGCFGRGDHTLTVNYGADGLRKAIEARDVSALVDFLVHEFAHDRESNHLSEEYHKACTRLAGRLVELALDRPSLFELR